MFVSPSKEAIKQGKYSEHSFFTPFPPQLSNHSPSMQMFKVAAGIKSWKKFTILISCLLRNKTCSLSLSKW